MAIFDFPYHVSEFDYAVNSDTVKLSGGFVFGSEPTEPYLKEFTLTFSALKWFVDGAGVPESTTEPQLNCLTLNNFYLTHGLWKTFTYPSPMFGDVSVKFERPLSIPKVVGNLGVVPNLEVKLIEVTA